MRKLLFVMAFALIFLYACAPATNQPLLQYKTGTSGVTLKFAKNAPPASVFENNDFEIAILLENKGAYDVKGNKGILRVITDENIQLLQTNYDIFSLLGRSAQNPDGEQKIVAFRARARQLPVQTEITTSQISVMSCYPYSSEATADVCIDTDIYEQIEARKKPCTERSVSLSGQGGPVAITKIDAQIIPIDNDNVVPQFTITISNRGKGEVVQQDILQRLCLGTASAEEKAAAEKVFIEDAFVGQNPLECITREVKLKDGEATFTCRTFSPIPRSQPTFSTSLAMRISYGYLETIGASIEVKKSPFEQ